MRLPRDCSGRDLARRLGALGYEIRRQTGSHLRLNRPGEPSRGKPRSRSSLSAILADVATTLGRPKAKLIRELFGLKDLYGDLTSGVIPRVRRMAELELG